ncbi:MAG: tetratricopeptide repeat protein [Verrucomicrobiae bacterium]|nr:tetratricopeptide repeat protein [Verrucomicrobiae bacterium]
MPDKSVNEIPREVRPLFTKGNDALVRENFDYAISLFTQVLDREPAVYECRKALRKAQFGKAGSGRSFFKKVMSSAGSSPGVVRAQVALRKNPAEALQLAEHVLNGDPTNSGAHKVVVEAATALDLPHTAVLSLEILARNHPKDKNIAIQLANALAGIGEVQRAETTLVELARSMPNDIELAQALKNVAAKRTMHEGGYNTLAEGEGSYRDILKNEAEAVALEQEQRVQKTEDTAERLIQEYETRSQTEPGNLKLIRSLAELYTQKNQFDRALQYYDRVKASEMGNDPSLDRAIASTRVRQFDHEIETLDPNAADYSSCVAELNAGKLAFQLAECQQRVEKYPTDLGMRFELGVLLFQAGKISEAIAEFQRAQGNPHKRIAALNYLAQCFARRKIFDLAADTLQDAIKEKLVLDDEKKELIYNLGRVFEDMDKKAEAIEQFKLIYKVDSSYRDVGAKVDAFYAGQ